MDLEAWGLLPGVHHSWNGESRKRDQLCQLFGVVEVDVEQFRYLIEPMVQRLTPARPCAPPRRVVELYPREF
jgi:hypothetical protein